MEKEATYIKYFNYGYVLAEHDPKILTRLLEAKIDSKDVSMGLKDGKTQYEKEQELSKILDIADVRKRVKNKDKDIEPDL